MKKNMNASTKIRWLIIGVIVLAAAGGGGAYYYFNSRSRRTSSTRTVAPVQTTAAFRGNIILEASGSGTLTPANQVNFGFGTSGQITELDVKIGDHVDAGQIIGKMDDAAAKAAYDEAKRNLADLTTPAAIAQAQQAAAQSVVDVTNALKNLQYLVSPDVYYWQDQVSAAQEALTTAQATGGTNPTADQQKAIDSAKAALTKAQDNLDAANQHYVNVYAPAFFSQTVVTGTTRTPSGKIIDATSTVVVPPSDAQIAAARATYQLAIENQKAAQAYVDWLTGKTTTIPQNVTGTTLSPIVTAQTALQTAQNNLNATQLTSPISGTVTSLTANVGDAVTTTSIVTVADISQPYTIDAFFDTSDWANIQVGYATNIAFDVLPNQTFPGKVTVVFPTLDTSSNSPLVHATVKLDKALASDLPIGATASVDVISGQANNAVLIPVEALHQTDPGKYAVFVMTNGKLRLHLIDVGLQDATYAEVKSGLQVGDVVSTGITAVQ